MHILVTGANGFIGSQIVATLLKEGHKVTCCGHSADMGKQRFPLCDWISSDFTHDTGVDCWLPRLDNIDAVINCAGILHHPNEDIIFKIHFNTPRAIFDACVQKKIKKVIQISAQGVSLDAGIAYAESKAKADEYLLSLDLDAVVVRPSLVYGSGSYGGTSLFRALAVMPGVVPILGGDTLLQPIHIEDLAKGICRLVSNPAPANPLLYAVGPETISLRDVMSKLRSWLGYGKARIWNLPKRLVEATHLVTRWYTQSPINPTAIEMLDRLKPEDSSDFYTEINFKPRGFTEALNTMPSQTQDRWHAKLYLLRPCLRITLALMWIVSGILPLTVSRVDAISLLQQMGLSGVLTIGVLYATCAADIVIGWLTLIRWRIRLIGKLQLFVVAVYTLLSAVLLPAHWLDPLGALVKNLPVLLTIAIMIIIEEQR